MLCHASVADADGVGTLPAETGAGLPQPAEVMDTARSAAMRRATRAARPIDLNSLLLSAIILCEHELATAPRT